MTRYRGLTAPLLVSELNVHGSSHLADVNVGDKHQSATCLQQQFFMAVSAMAHGRRYIAESDLVYREPASKRYPFIRNDVKESLASQLRKYVSNACNLFGQGVLSEFRLQVVKVATGEVLEELGFIFQYFGEDEALEGGGASAGSSERQHMHECIPSKNIAIQSAASVQAARERLMNTINTFCGIAKNIMEQVELDAGSTFPALTVVPWFLCRDETHYFDLELAQGGTDKTMKTGPKRGKRGGKAKSADATTNEFHAYRRVNPLDMDRLTGGKYVRMIQLKTAFHAMSLYAKVRRSSLSVQQKPQETLHQPVVRREMGQGMRVAGS